MNNGIRYILASAVLLAAALCTDGYRASAQESSALSLGTVVRDPVRAAKGGAGTASVSDVAYASMRNAAAVPYYDGTLDAGVGYQAWRASDMQNLSLAGSWNINGKFGLTASFGYGLGSPYDIFGDDGRSAGSFTPSAIQAGVGFGWKFLPWLSAGVNVRYLGETLAKGHGYGAVSSDIFLMSRTGAFTVALGVSSLGSAVSSESGESFSQPASLALAAGYLKEFASEHSIELLLDADYYLYGGAAAAFGAEYSWRDMLSARAGYHYGYRSVIPSYASAGLGLKLFGVSLDFAYLFAPSDSPLKNTMTVGLGYSF